MSTPRTPTTLGRCCSFDDGVIGYELDRQVHAAAPRVRVRLLPPHVVHDGRSATSSGFRKRVVYLEADVFAESLIGAAVDGPLITDDYLRPVVSGLDQVLALGDDLEAESCLNRPGKSADSTLCWTLCYFSPIPMTIVMLLQCDRWHIAAVLVQSSVVEPIDIACRLRRYLRGVTPGTLRFNELGLVQSIDGLGQGIIVRIADYADRWINALLDETFSEPNRRVLTAGIAVKPISV